MSHVAASSRPSHLLHRLRREWCLAVALKLRSVKRKKSRMPTPNISRHRTASNVAKSAFSLSLLTIARSCRVRFLPAAGVSTLPPARMHISLGQCEPDPPANLSQGCDERRNFPKERQAKAGV